ncbi:MAG TPA: class I SAM-dependent methyltransferase [Opitutaceae bacterium]|nr:class I SAM-dependent methyltransferase [Opitutaceae bacterium]
MIDDLARQVEELGPWITGFRTCGRQFGGTYDATNDERITRLPVFVPRARRILECGCLEGGHTALLGRVYPMAGITAVDVREANLARARLLTSVAGIRPPDFRCLDLETAELSDLGSFDLTVCIGLLYHLREPWRFLARVGAISGGLWIWTQICAESDASMSDSGYRGRIYVEGPTDHVLAAVRTESFFPTIGSLCDMVRAAGFQDLHLLNFETTPNGPAVMMHATKEPFRTS